MSRQVSTDRELREKGIHDEMLLGFVVEREAQFARISRFLHDEVGQVLSAVGLQLDALRHDFAAQAPDLNQRTAEIQQMLEPTIGRIRDLSNELNPSVVLRIGLQSALERLAGRFRDECPGGVRVQLDPTVHVPAEPAESMYRAAEAVIELAKTTPGCTHVDVHLKRRGKEFVLELRANAALDVESKSRFPALLLSYYGNRDNINLIVNRAGEKDTIIRFSCPAIS